MNLSRKLSKCLVLASIALAAWTAGAGSIAFAGPIQWGAAQNIAGDSDVSADGTLVYAYHFGPAAISDTTINGVTFARFALPDAIINQTAVTVGNVSIWESPGYLYGNFALGTSTPSTSYAALSAAYKDLVKNGATSSLPPAINLSLGGLVVGETYDFQWWSSQSTGYPTFGLTTAAAGNSLVLESNTLADQMTTAGYDGGTGQYAIGRFTADNTTFLITFNGQNNYDKWPLINGFQLRLVPTPVPEIDPAGIGSVLALVSGALGLLERRRAKAA